MALGVVVAGALGALTSPVTCGLLVAFAILAHTTVLELPTPQADNPGAPAWASRTA